MNIIKTGDVELNFLKEYLFNAEIKPLLEFRGRKEVGGISLSNLEEIEMGILDIVFGEALRLDE